MILSDNMSETDVLKTAYLIGFSSCFALQMAENVTDIKEIPKVLAKVITDTLERILEKQIGENDLQYLVDYYREVSIDKEFYETLRRMKNA